MARVFLTGGSGFVGAALLDALRDRGDVVVALARSDAAERSLRARGADVARGDILDEDALVAGMSDCELVFHVAGINTLCPADPTALFHANVRGAETVVRAAARAGIARVVHTSSAATLGEPHGTIGREDSPHRGSYLSSYERSKHEGELAALAAARRTGVELVSVNPSSVQGPGRSGGTGRILLAYLNGTLKAFLDTRLSLVDIADCTTGHLLAAERGAPGERYILNGVTLTSHEALALLTEIAGVDHRPRILPAPVASAAAAIAEAGFRVLGRTPPVCREMVRTMLHGHLYDGSRATRELGLAYTPVRETLARTIDWAVAAGLITRPLPGRAARASPDQTAGM
ncbi:MAG TPA: NAD-dependent epimerase/dehydratase family protein [Baekduia sp.]|nr:NAD-dependent epimerase/dehydratase family protein [Baekduia sp.]